MKLTQKAKWLFVLVLFLSFRANALPGDTTEFIHQFMSTLHERGQFNGSILVARQGKIIYRQGFGNANFRTSRPFRPGTPSAIASVSKQFTALAIMMLAEQKKLNYDDPVLTYIKEFPGYSAPLTIRHLLTHTSGIPDYPNIGLDHPGLTNAELLDRLIKYKVFSFKPGEKYEYSNTNYVLLAIIIERVSGQSFDSFLHQRIFGPLNMNDTFIKGSPSQKDSIARAYDEFGQEDDANPPPVTDGINGDAGIYSTVDDLLKWDQALYTEKLVQQSTLAEAFTSYPVRTGTTTYGFGWNITGSGDEKFVWHTGKTEGYRAFIERRLKDRVTVIMLTNEGNSNRQDINTAVLNILAGKPYSFPKIPIAGKMYKTIHTSGVQAAMQLYDSLKATKDSAYDFSENELNILGYQLLYADKNPEAAIVFFKLNTVQYPASSNSFDSLGEAYTIKGDKKQAIASYEKALTLDPGNVNSSTQLKKIK